MHDPDPHDAREDGPAHTRTRWERAWRLVLLLSILVPVTTVFASANVDLRGTYDGLARNSLYSYDIPCFFNLTTTSSCTSTTTTGGGGGNTSPLTPTLVAPTNGATNQSTTPAFSATFLDNDNGDKGTVEFQICTTSACSVIVDSGVSAQVNRNADGTWTPTTPLANGTYWWRARNVDVSNYVSGYAAAWSFTVGAGGNAAPSSPSTLAQYRNDGTTVIASGATTPDGITNNIVLKFTVSDPDASQTLTPWVEYRPNATAFSGTCGTAVANAVVSGAAINTTTAGASYTATVNITGLSTSTSYHWRACVRDGGSLSSAWVAKGASPDFVTAAGTPPTAPTLVSPTGGTWVNSRTPTLTAQFNDPNAGDTGQLTFELCSTNATDPWSANCASGYQTGASATGVAIGSTGTWAPNTPVTENVLYYWRARGTDQGSLTGPWATSQSFRADATPPSAPTNIRPDTRGLGAVRIAWDPSTDSGVGGITYDVEWSTDGVVWQAESSCTDIAATGCQHGGLGGQALVYFRVYACDALGNCSDAVTTNESVGSGYYLRTVTPTYWSSLLTNPANRIVTSSSSAAQTTTVADFRNTTGWYLLSPGITQSSRQSVAEPANTPWTSTGSGWVVDSFRGLAIDDGPLQVVAKTNSTASSAVAFLQARAWRVTTDGAGTITSSTFLGKATTSADVADGISGVSRTIDINSPGIAQPVTLGPNESIYVELWLNVTNGAGSADMTIVTDDTSSYVVLPPAGPPPNVPTLQAPSTGSLVGLSPTLTANYTHPTPSNGYVECQVATDAAFTSVVDQGNSGTVASGANASYAINATLAEGTLHYWRCRARDIYGRASAWSSSWQFTTDTRPNQPTNVFPANAGTATLTPTLTASAFSDPNSGAYQTASQWQLRTATGSYSFPVADSGTTTSSLGSWTVPTTLTAGTVYDWRVRYRDEFGVWSNWSSETSFTAQAAPPVNTAPNSPSALQQYKSDGVTVLGSGAWNDSDTVRFSVSASDPDANALLTAWVELRSSAVFSSTCGAASANTYGGATVSAPTAGTPVTLNVTASGLTSGSSYYWRVCVQDQYGATSSWVVKGGTPDFRIDSVDPTVTQTSPAAGIATSTTTPTLAATYADPSPGTTGRIDFRIGTSATCGTSVVQSGSSATGLAAAGASGSWTTAALAAGTYYWCAQAVDAAGNVSPWSPAWQLVIGGASLTVTVDNASQAMSPSLVAVGVDATARTRVDVQTNNGTGYTLNATDSSDTVGMTQPAVDTVPDWTGTNAAPSLWAQGTPGYFGLSVLSATNGKDTARWGAGSTAGDFANLRYVGLRTTNTLLYSRSTFSMATDSIDTTYRVDFSGNELSGSYATTVSYTAIPNP